MKANAARQPVATGDSPGNLIPLPAPSRARQTNQAQHRFRVIEYQNPRTLTTSFRVTGIKRNGERVRENFKDRGPATCRQIELEAEYNARETDVALSRATSLTDSQIKIAESAFARLDVDSDLILAVDFWRKHSKKHVEVERVRLDDAVKEFLAHLDRGFERKKIRFHTRRNLRTRINIFANSVGNHCVDDFDAVMVKKYLDGRGLGVQSHINDRSALSTFFEFCRKHTPKWCSSNPAREVESEKVGERTPPVLTVDESETYLRNAEKFRGGKLLPYVVYTHLVGIRPEEAQRMTPEMVNAIDWEIVLPGEITKTKRSRTIRLHGGPKEQATFNECVKAWVNACKGKPIFPPNADNDLEELRRISGFGNPKKDPALKLWPKDVARHTAITHFFRLTGSYGLAAEMFGNSEAKIKQHYQSAKITSADTARFYAIAPKGKAKK